MKEEINCLKEIDGIIENFAIKLNAELENTGTENCCQSINALAALVTARANYRMAIRCYESSYRIPEG